MASSVWRRYIGNGWETIIQGADFMQERFKMLVLTFNRRVITFLFQKAPQNRYQADAPSDNEGQVSLRALLSDAKENRII